MQRIIFDAAGLPGDEGQRKDQWIENLSSGYVRLNADPDVSVPFRGSLRIAALRNVAVGTIQGTVKAITRTGREIALEDTDNIVLLCNAGKQAIRIVQGAGAVDLSEGSSVLIEQCRPSQITAPHGSCRLLALQAPRAWLRARRPLVESQIMKPIGRHSSAQDLAKAYAGILLRDEGSEPLEGYASDHIADLIVAIGSSSQEPVETRGVRAARLRAIKDDIARHLGSPSLSASEIASRQGISPAYLRKLFFASGTSFTDFVLGERLSRAYRMLRDSRLASRQIGTIAFDVGFSDLSYFNRTFRRRYGATPSEVRASSRDEEI